MSWVFCLVLVGWLVGFMFLFVVAFLFFLTASHAGETNQYD
jgi:hypothetical protein